MVVWVGLNTHHPIAGQTSGWNLTDLVGCNISQNPLLKKKEMHKIDIIGKEIVDFVSTNGLAYASDNWAMGDLFSRKMCVFYQGWILIRLTCVWMGAASLWIPHPPAFLMVMKFWCQSPRASVSYPAVMSGAILGNVFTSFQPWYPLL